MKRKVNAGVTSLLDKVFIRDISQTNYVKGLTGLTSSSSGLTCYYIRNGDSSTTSISLTAGSLGTWSSGGFVEVDSTHMPGLYEFGIPNAAVAAGKPAVVIYFQGATNMESIPAQYELDAVNYQSNTSFIAAVSGLTPPANWNLEAISTGGQVGVDLTNIKQATAPTTLTNITVPATTSVTNSVVATVSGTVVTSSGTVTTVTNPVSATISGSVVVSSGTVTSVTNPVVVNGGSIGAVVSGVTVASGTVTSITNPVIVNGGSIGTVVSGVVVTGGTVTSVVNPVTVSAGTVTSVTNPVTVGTNNDKTNYTLGATGLDSIAITDPGTPGNWTTFPRVLIAFTRRFLSPTSVSSGVLTMYKDDGATINATQGVTDNGSTQTVGKAS